MNPIQPINRGAQGAAVAVLHAALLFLIRNQGGISDNDRRTLEQGLVAELRDQTYGKWTVHLVSLWQEQLKERFQLIKTGNVDQATADALNKLLSELGAPTNGQPPKPPAFEVKGFIRLADQSPARVTKVSAFDRDLRSEQLLGQTQTDNTGAYRIGYSDEQFRKRERGGADLVVKALAADGSPLAASPVLFNAPAQAVIDLIIPAQVRVPLTLFEKIAAALPPLLDGVKVEELEENQQFQDLSYLAGETGFAKRDLARFVLARMLAPQGIQAEFWFALLGGSLFEYAEGQSLKVQLTTLTDAMPALDAATIRKALIRGFDQKDIPEPLSGRVDEWIAAFLKFAARQTVRSTAAPSFTKQALDQAGIKDAAKQEKFALLFNQYQSMTPDLIAALQKDPTFAPAEIANLDTSYRLADLTRGDFSVVETVKNAFGVHEPAQIPSLAMKSENEWVDLVKRGQAAGTLTIPIGLRQPADAAVPVPMPEATLYGQTLERQFREAFPTAAFAGGLSRALNNGGARGLQHAEALSGFLQGHGDFELLTTPVDEFLNTSVRPELRALAQDQSFRSELKAAQRVFQLAPTFDATNTLLADGLHSAQQVYRQGPGEFVSRYAGTPGFTAESATLAWNQAANKYAGALTVVGELISFDAGGLPAALTTSSTPVSSFPNWNNLFQSGDLCDCEHCRSVLGPAAYFADLLIFLKDRAAKSTGTVKDILFKRRPDLGFIELNCDNALTPLPYIDVVCEVLEAKVAGSASDVPLNGFNAMPAVPADAKAAVTTEFANHHLTLGADFSVSQVVPSDPNRWVVHGDEATFLLTKTAATDFSARILCNTKASAAELRAYPAYVDAKAYETLRAARFPFNLPFDLFAEEVRAAFQKCNLQRWDLMRTLRGPAAPNNPGDGDIAAEYFGISSSPAAPIDEKRLILVSDTDATFAPTQAAWGETVNTAWLTKLANVKTFLNKSGLEFDQLLTLLDLKFVNPVDSNSAREIVLQRPDPSCDTDKMLLVGLNGANLDRIHRFLRLWRKLGWKMWEVDLAIRQAAIGNGALNEAFLINLFALARLRTRLGEKTTVEQLSALCGDLNAETHFTKLDEKRGDGLYQSLFLNKRLVQPLDHAFDVAALGASTRISDHLPVMLAALRVSETDLAVFRTLTRASDSTPYITDDLTLANISFLWRHSWLSKQLKLKPQEWAILLKLFQQDVPQFTDPLVALEFIEKIDVLKASGFTPDELDWLLAANRDAKAAVKEADAARFLIGLRKDLEAIRAEFDPAQYAFLDPPSDEDSLVALLTSLLLKLGRDEAAAQFFVDILRDRISQEQVVRGLPEGFKFDSAITGTADKPIIPIRYEPALLFTGAMTADQKAILLNDASLSGVTELDSYKDAINALFKTPGKAAMAALPANFDFPPAITGGTNNIPIRFEPVLRLVATSVDAHLQFAGTMTEAQKTTLLNDPSLSAVTALDSYQKAIKALFQTPGQPATFELPSGFDFPAVITGAPNSIPIRYEPPLRLGGRLTDEQWSTLVNDVPDAAFNLEYRRGIDIFHDRPLLAVKFFDPVFVAPLHRLPPAVDFKALPDPTLTLKIAYDTERHVLRVSGILSDEDKHALDLLSDDVPYQSAVQSLFDQPRQTSFIPGVVWLTGTDLQGTTADKLATAVVRALDDLANRASEGHVVQQTAAQLGLTEALTRYLLTQYGVVLNVPQPGQAMTLLDYLIGPFAASGGALDYATQSSLFDSWYWACRAAALAKKWNIVPADAEKIAALNRPVPAVDRMHQGRGLLVDIGEVLLLDIGGLPVNATRGIASVDLFSRTSRLIRLRDRLSETGITLLELLEKLKAEAYTATVNVQGLPAAFEFPMAIIGHPDHIQILYDEPNKLLRFTGPMSTAQRARLLTDASLQAVTSDVAYQQAIDKLFRSLTADFAADVQRLNPAWTAAEVEALVVGLQGADTTAYLLMETWERLSRAFYFLDSLNAGADRVMAFAASVMGMAETRPLKELLRSKFGSESWLALSADIQDALRERKRDALAAWLLAQQKPLDAPSGKWDNTNDLYAYYLLDVEMCSCQLTSRLVQASGSVQLFVQRCFMGLEPEVAVEPDGPSGHSAWRWWKWMRKYRVWEANRKVFLWPENWIAPELKKDRSQFFKDLESELQQNEINQYSAETAFANYLEKLDAVAQLEIAGFYHEDDGDDAIVHVFGRTKGAEPHLYYYRRYDYRQWTPWEKVDLDIPGDYLIPAVVAKRLFLFWPVFTEVSDETSNSKVTTPEANKKDTPLQKTAKKLRVQMAVSDFRQGKWSPKRVSKDFDESKVYSGDIVRKHYRFFLVDRSEIDGRFGIKFDGYSAGSGPNEGVVVTSNLVADGIAISIVFPATLSGAFEISGCGGAPVSADLPGNFRSVIRPEDTFKDTGDFLGVLLGDSPTFQKWLEASPRKKNDFTLQNLAGTPTVYDDLNPKFFTNPTLTPVLLQTPGRFEMTPAWQLSYLDKLFLDTNMGEPGAGEPPVPSGIGLPFFYNDKQRTFFVLPAYRANIAALPLEYYPDVKRPIRALHERFEQHIRGLLAKATLPATGSPVRENLERFLSLQFPGEPPPYTDAQVRELLVRGYMRNVRHRYLGRAVAMREFHFKNFYHSFVCDFARLVNNPLQGIPGLMRRETQLKNSEFSFKHTYRPQDSVVVPGSEDFYPREIVDFSPDGAYSSYNWELFFHAPLLIANALSRNQRFEEARDWYHFIFNPLGVDGPIPGGPAMSKFWITKPFFETADSDYVQQRIDNILNGNLDLESAVRDWRTNPFEPHRIASYRTVAYQKTVVMNYLDNLIAWGDLLFRQDSMESINEATQLYVMAAEILGPRPKKIPPTAKPPLKSFNELESELDAFSNALVQVENLIPQTYGNSGSGNAPPLPVLYFCIPQNDKMLGYWDTVADRLYKIRHCMNIEGVVRQLALFEPPIDPGALVKAVAGGVDIGSALADLNAPLPLYRFQTLLQKANELCGDVKALGGALLGALEKKDAEALSLLRQGQEIRLLEAAKAVRERQIEEAKENLEGARRSRLTVEERRNFYRDVEKVSDTEAASMIAHGLGIVSETVATIMNATAGTAHLIPSFTLGAAGFGGTPTVLTVYGGGNVASSASKWASFFGGLGGILHSGANLISTQASNERRWDDWKLQERLAEKELSQLDTQIAAGELRVAIAETELANHLIQIENAQATDDFMRSKYTNEELYQWQVGQISGVYFQSYKLAYDLAKRAERCFRFELGVQDSSYISFGYWDSLKKGLLSGEKLQYDLRRLESAYLEQNRRELELTKHVSLLLLDPLALVQLRETGKCFFRIPEELFDLDYPGHYFRRIKSVSLTLPCVTGPYTTIACTLRLLKNSVRINTAKGDGYPRNIDGQGLPADDTRFVENNIPVKAIAASGGQNDSGVFELSFRDERYLPFEGAGVISEWSLELFNDKPLRQFDYGTISDAIVHIKYTAREDAGPFKNDAVKHLRTYFSQDDASPSLRLFNLRQEFPAQWSRFLNPTNQNGRNTFQFDMSPDLFRMMDAGKTLNVNTIWLLARATGTYSVTITPPGTPRTLTSVQKYGQLQSVELSDQSILIPATGMPIPWSIEVTGTPAAQPIAVDDLFLVLRYGFDPGP